MKCETCGHSGLMTKEQLAAWLGVPPSFVRDAITARRIPITWVGKHARFSEADRAAIVAAGHEPALTAPTSITHAPRRSTRRKAA